MQCGNSESSMPSSEDQLRQAIEPFVKYIRLRLNLFGVNSRSSYPEMWVSDPSCARRNVEPHTAQVLKQDWNALLKAVEEYDAQQKEI